MLLDLHVHSVYSGDSPIKIAEYARRAAELKSLGRLDGFVLMEHDTTVPQRSDLEDIAREFGVVILAGVEADTYWGHFLLYGVDFEMWESIRPRKIKKLNPVELMKELAGREDVAVVPAHPFRAGFMGAGDRIIELPGIAGIEGLNGGNTDLENLAALMFGHKREYAMTGGSDAHFLAELGGCVTRLSRDVSSMTDIVREIREGRVAPVKGHEI